MEVMEIIQEQESDEGDIMPKEETTKLMQHFTEGQLVEVKITDDQGLGDSWFTAKVLKLVNQTALKRVLVEYERPPDVARMIYVNVSLVRPVPIVEGRDRFLLNEAVDAFHGNGWRKGRVIDAGTARYTVYFPRASREKCMDFELKDLRVHRDWIAGKWSLPQDEDKTTKLDQVEGGDSVQAKEDKLCDLSKMQVQYSKESAVTESPPLRITGSDEQHCKRTKGKGWKCPRMASPGQIYCDKHRLERDMYNKKRRKSRKEESPFLMADDKGQMRIEDVGFKSPMENGGWTQINHGSVELGGVMKTQSTKCSTQREAFCSEMVIKEEKGVVRRQTATIVEPRIDGQSKGFVSEGNVPDNHFASQTNIVISSGEVLKKCLDVQKPLNMINGSMSSEGQTKSGYDFHKASEDGLNETVTRTLLFDHNKDEITVRNDKLPFVKSHPAWEIVESRKIHSMPQYPHFRPLQQRNEYLREGEAVGYMISFSNIVDQTKRAKLEDPRSSLENKLYALPELEAMGLNVQPVRAQLCELLSAKDEHLHLDAELNQLEEKLLQEKLVEDLANCEMDKIDEEIKELEESISQMKRKLQRLLVVKQIHEVKGKIHDTVLRFNRVAAAPW